MCSSTRAGERRTSRASSLTRRAQVVGGLAAARDVDTFFAYLDQLPAAVQAAADEVNYVLDDGPLKTTALAYLAAAARALD